MKVHIIPSDNVVGVDGVSYFDIDLSWLPDVDGKKIHAVHWDDEKEEGEVEFVGPAHPMSITSFGIEEVCNFTKAISQWQEKRDEELELIRKEEEAAARMQKELDAAMQETMLDFNRTHLAYNPTEEGEETAEEDGEEEEDLYYDIEELLKEI